MQSQSEVQVFYHMITSGTVRSFTTYTDMVQYNTELLSYCSHHAALATLRLRQNGCCLADNTFKVIFFNENVRILIKISLNFVPKGLINNIAAVVQITAWLRTGDNLPTSHYLNQWWHRLPTHKCITRAQLVNAYDAETKWPLFGRPHFQTNFFCVKIVVFHSNVTEIWSN